jgi:hypothetical protein
MIAASSAITMRRRSGAGVWAVVIRHASAVLR